MAQEKHASTSNRAGACALEFGRRAEHLATATVMVAMIGIILLQTFPAARGPTSTQSDSLAPAVTVLMRGV